MINMEYTKAISFIDGKRLECACRFESSRSKAETKRISEEFEFLGCARDAIEYRMPTPYEFVNDTMRCIRCGHIAVGSKYCPGCGQRTEVGLEKSEKKSN